MRCYGISWSAITKVANRTGRVSRLPPLSKNTQTLAGLQCNCGRTKERAHDPRAYVTNSRTLPKRTPREFPDSHRGPGIRGKPAEMVGPCLATRLVLRIRSRAKAFIMQSDPQNFLPKAIWQEIHLPMRKSGERISAPN